MDVSRRFFVSGASATIILGPTEALAFCKLCKLSRLHPSRFIAGLVFDLATAVLVRTASDLLITQILTGSYFRSGSRSAYVYTPARVMTEASFDLNAYKAAIITLGIADYEVHRQENIRLLLDAADEDSLRRLAEVRQYMVSERISTKTYGDHLSYPVTAETSFDDLLSVEYFGADDANKERHIQNLIDATGVTVFNGWS